MDMIGKLKLDGWQLYYESIHFETPVGGHACKGKACGDRTDNWYEVFERWSGPERRQGQQAKHSNDNDQRIERKTNIISQ